MELWSSPTEYLFLRHSAQLRCCRKTGCISFEQTSKQRPSANFTRHGCFYGILGCLSTCSAKNNSNDYLLLISGHRFVGQHPFSKQSIYQISQVSAVPWKRSQTVANPLIGCRLDSSNEKEQLVRSDPHHVGGQKFWSTSVVQPLVKYASNQMKKPTQSTTIGGDQSKDQLLEDVLKLFNDNGCFYHCPGADLTNCVQCLVSSHSKAEFNERFYWNRQMALWFLKDSPLIYDASKFISDGWLSAVINGHVSILTEDAFSIAVISRRSVRRAGTRYLKRGLDADGHCANYVETEQIVRAFDHVSSFVIVRGSVPIFWTQQGYKYRPPPMVLKSTAETATAFGRHVEEQIALYGSKLVLINLVDPTGNEKALDDAYFEMVLNFDDDRLVYAPFNFNAHCRGMHFENVALLINAIDQYLRAMKFCWVDKSGQAACQQNGVFRVNCVDCLDRTNVVQTAIAKLKLEEQLGKFGMLLPEETLSPRIAQAFRVAWANNGDAISRQYTGTDALKGDYTRTGQQNVTSMMKDGYRSVNRYYLNHVKDRRRQLAIDSLLGTVSKEECDDEEESSSKALTEDAIRQLVKDCENFVVGEDEFIIASWVLLNAYSRVPATTSKDPDIDTIVILTKEAYYMTSYDETMDKFVKFQRVPLHAIGKVEYGPLSMHSTMRFVTFKADCVRICFVDERFQPVCHVWRSANCRLFNGVMISISNKEEAAENLLAIVEQFRVAFTLANLNIPVLVSKRLSRSGVSASNGDPSSKLKLPKFRLLQQRPTCADVPVDQDEVDVQLEVADGQRRRLSIRSSHSDDNFSMAAAAAMDVRAARPRLGLLSSSCQNFVKKFGSEIQQTAQKTAKDLLTKPRGPHRDRYSPYRHRIQRCRSTFILL